MTYSQVSQPLPCFRRGSMAVIGNLAQGRTAYRTRNQQGSHRKCVSPQRKPGSHRKPEKGVCILQAGKTAEGSLYTSGSLFRRLPCEPLRSRMSKPGSYSVCNLRFRCCLQYYHFLRSLSTLFALILQSAMK